MIWRAVARRARSQGAGRHNPLQTCRLSYKVGRAKTREEAVRALDFPGVCKHTPPAALWFGFSPQRGGKSGDDQRDRPNAGNGENGDMRLFNTRVATGVFL